MELKNCFKKILSFVGGFLTYHAIERTIDKAYPENKTVQVLTTAVGLNAGLSVEKKITENLNHHSLSESPAKQWVNDTSFSDQFRSR